MDTNGKATTFKELVKTKEYKNSNYRLMRVSGKYGLKEKKLGKYLDLVETESTHHWNIRENYLFDCISNEEEVIKAFYRHHFFKKKIEEKFKEIPFEKDSIKETLNSYKSKLMEGLE